MHFRVTGAFTFFSVFLSILSIASPLSPPTNVVVDELNVRQINIVTRIIIDIAEGIIENIINDIFEFDSNAHTVERNFTQQMIALLGDRYPDKNRLVFHNPKSTCDFSPDAVHAHYEVDIGNILGLLDFTQGYEIYVFDSGTFSLAGDGGYENWAYAGCYTRLSTAPVATPPVIFTTPILMGPNNTYVC